MREFGLQMEHHASKNRQLDHCWQWSIFSTCCIYNWCWAMREFLNVPCIISNDCSVAFFCSNCLYFTTCLANTCIDFSDCLCVLFTRCGKLVSSQPREHLTCMPILTSWGHILMLNLMKWETGTKLFEKFINFEFGYLCTKFVQSCNWHFSYNYYSYIFF